MPRYAYQKPRAKVYAYNFGYMNNYYKPMTHYLSKEPSHPTERPGAQSLAERLKKFPMDGSIYPDKDEIYVPSASVSPAREIEPRVYAPLPVFEHEDSVPPPKRVPAEEGRRILPLHLKHPYRLPVEDERMWRYFDPIWFCSPWTWDCIWVPPHESRTTPHFGVEAYRDLITRFLRLKPLTELTSS
ncbi:uncharacterized protein [Macrobrachium rosenbergii]|uniref:uncharacterized protein isoform X3 n=1 Tax=Macrobrachium rosenbergii TaxID=79674 RepID=UPI0034D60BCC